MDATHEVFNQAEPLVGTNLFSGNRALRDALAFNAPALPTAELEQLRALAGSAEMQTHARLANVHLPQLRSHDRLGRRTDVVEFHPSYHALMAAAIGAGLHGTPWAGGANAHLRRAAGVMRFTEVAPSLLCPIPTAFSVTPALRAHPSA